ncbi:MAG TPA: hypothetical protein VK063_11755 [Beutenbergiaceae bacterium]|nr:hypothetical protein [Beutenbergiaceae bacterium]
MDKVSPWRPALIITAVALIVWVGVGLVSSALLWSGRTVTVVQLFTQTIPPVTPAGGGVMAALALTLVFALVLLLLLRALFSGNGASGAATFLGTCGATSITLASVAAVYVPWYLAMVGFLDQYMVQQVVNILGNRLLPTLWLGPLLGLTALVVHRPRRAPRSHDSGGYWPASGPDGEVGMYYRGG